MYHLAVTTHNGLYSVVLDSNFDLDSVFRLDTDYHYGATVSYDAKTNETLLNTYRGGPGKESVLPPEIREWRIGENQIENVKIYPLYADVGDVHQLTKSSNGELLITNTSFNSLDLWCKRTGVCSVFQFGDHRYDVNHVNSVLRAGDICLVMLHNLRKMESQIAILQLSTDNLWQEIRRFSLWDYCCHNVGVLGKNMFVNASSAKAMVRLDINTLKENRRVNFGEHTKGLSSDGQFVFAGMSNSAARSDRVRSHGWINVVDPDSMKLIKKISIHEDTMGYEIGNINEIRLLRQRDWFDECDELDPLLTSRLTKISQNATQILLRRFAIKVVDKTRRLIRNIVE